MSALYRTDPAWLGRDAFKPKTYSNYRAIGHMMHWATFMDRLTFGGDLAAALKARPSAVKIVPVYQGIGAETLKAQRSLSFKKHYGRTKSVAR